MPFAKITPVSNPQPGQKLFDTGEVKKPVKEKLKKLGTADEYFSKEEITKNKGVFDIPFMIPSARSYVLDPLDKIEDIYLAYPATLMVSRILRMCGHIRFLRDKLRENGIEFNDNDATLSQRAEDFMLDFDDLAWAKREEARIASMMVESKPLRMVVDSSGKEIPVENYREDEEVLAGVEVYDTSDIIDDSEDEEDDEE